MGPADTKASDPEGVIGKDGATRGEAAVPVAVGVCAVCLGLTGFLLADHAISAVGCFAGGQTGIGLVPIPIVAGFTSFQKTVSADRG